MMRRALGNDSADVSSVMSARAGGAFTSLEDFSSRTSILKGTDGTHDANETVSYSYYDMTGTEANNIVTGVNNATQAEIDNTGTYSILLHQ